MTEKDFFAKVKSLPIDFYYRNEHGHYTQYWHTPEEENKKRKKTYDKIQDIDLYVEKHWETGGESGGSCWDSSQHYQVTPKPEPDFLSLDMILEILCPNITHLEYKKLARELIKNDDYRENEYYGNYTCFDQQVVKLIDLYKYLSTIANLI